MTPPTDGRGDLRRLAAKTDGGAIAADAEPGLRRVTADSSAYYLLSFRTAHPDDGQFRELQARVKRAGAVVRARKGYWTASPDEALRAAILAKANEPKVVVPLEPAPHASPLIRPWFGVSRGENGKTRVTFVWEPAAHVPGDRVRRTVSRIEFQAQVVRRHRAVRRAGRADRSGGDRRAGGDARSRRVRRRRRDGCACACRSRTRRRR